MAMKGNGKVPKPVSGKSNARKAPQPVKGGPSVTSTKGKGATPGGGKTFGGKGKGNSTGSFGGY